MEHVQAMPTLGAMRDDRVRVLIAGGGVAGIESLLAV
jgi:hypothetical protein